MNKFTKNVLSGLGIAAAAVIIASCGNPMGSTGSAGIAKSIVSSAVPSLGQAASFAVFGGGAGVTNQGIFTVINGDIGTTGASTMITGFHSSSFVYAETPLNIGAINGLVFSNAPQGSASDFVKAQAVAADALTAFNALAAIPDGIDPGAGQLGGLTLYSGVYKSAAGPFLISGSDLTLDAQGNPDAVWVFQMASSLTVGTPLEARSVILTNGAQAKNVYWQVGSAATINGAGNGTMVGTIIASAGMTFSTAGNVAVTTLNGRALGLFAVVTMVNTVINTGAVPAATPAPTATPVATPAPTATPVPAIPGVVLTGSNAADVVAVAGAGSINVQNNGGHVAVTEVGSGTINIVNNGGLLTATNTGSGLVTINSNATGAVTVTNTGNGKVTVNATGAAAVTVTHTGDEDFVYP